MTALLAGATFSSAIPDLPKSSDRAGPLSYRELQATLQAQNKRIQGMKARRFDAITETDGGGEISVYPSQSVDTIVVDIGLSNRLLKVIFLYRDPPLLAVTEESPLKYEEKTGNFTDVDLAKRRREVYLSAKGNVYSGSLKGGRLTCTKLTADTRKEHLSLLTYIASVVKTNAREVDISAFLKTGQAPQSKPIPFGEGHPARSV